MKLAENETLWNGKLPMNIQFFAEGDGGDGGENGNGDGDVGNDNQHQNKEINDDGQQIKNDDQRRQFAKAAADAVDKFKANEMPDLLQKAIDDALAKSKMSDADRQKADEKAKEDALKAREEKLNAREALADTKTLLSDKELDLSFAELLADTDETTRQKNVDNFAKLFNAAVHKAVLKATEGKADPGAGGNEVTVSEGEEIAKEMNDRHKVDAPNPWSKFTK